MYFLNSYTEVLRYTPLLVAATALPISSAWAQSCPASHPLYSAQCNQCFADANQANSAGCSVDGGGGGGGGGSDGGGSDGGGSDGCGTGSGRVVSGCRTADTQSWCDTNCVTYVGNGNDGCLNASGTFVSRDCICSDPANSREAILDIEINLGIDVDDAFIAASGYQGAPPSINPGISYNDARKYFVALLGESEGTQFANDLNLNGDNWLDRNEASAAKGADPTQTLNTRFGCGLSTDDVLAYIGLYLGDGAIDKYAGDLDSSVKNSMLEFTRSWQPGTSALACQYRGGCGTEGASTEAVQSDVAESTDDNLVFGMEADGTLFHIDGGQTGKSVYLCVDGDCRLATRNGDRFELETGITTGAHQLEFRIQDDLSGACLASTNGITPGNGVNASPCAVGHQAH